MFGTVDLPPVTSAHTFPQLRPLPKICAVICGNESWFDAIVNRWQHLCTLAKDPLFAF